MLLWLIFTVRMHYRLTQLAAELFCELPATLATSTPTFAKHAVRLNFRLAFLSTDHNPVSYWARSLEARIAALVILRLYNYI